MRLQVFQASIDGISSEGTHAFHKTPCFLGVFAIVTDPLRGIASPPAVSHVLPDYRKPRKNGTCSASLKDLLAVPQSSYRPSLAILSVFRCLPSRASVATLRQPASDRAFFHRTDVNDAH